MSAVDGGHVGCIVPVAGGGLERLQALDLPGAEFDPVRGRVLLHSLDPAGAGDRGDVVSPREDPGESCLRGGRADLGPDRADLVDECQVAPEILADEPGVVLAPIVVGEVVDRADLSTTSPTVVFSESAKLLPLRLGPPPPPQG